MEENEAVQTEVSETSLDAFDEAWNEDDVVTGDDDEFEEGDQDEGADNTDVDSEQPEEGQPEAAHDDEPSEDSENGTEEPRTETETANQRFKIKYNGAEEEYGLDELTTLAQKGRDYDHVREERDGMKGKYGKYEGFLQKLADKAGVSIDEQIDLTEAMWLMDAEAEKGNTITEAEALLRVQRERNAAPAQETQQPQKTESDKIIDRFLAVYPNVAATDIPKEVWDEASRIGDLLGAYQAYEIKRLKEENEKAKQAAFNEKNAQRSTGPRKSSGAKHERDAFDEGWDSEF